jgi:dihydroneopterin aldolase
MCCIRVKELRFFSHHGFYPEEQILGNEYLVSIEVSLPFTDSIDDNLKNTLNYEILYEIAKKEMGTPQKLLETVANNILNRTLSKSENNSIEKIKVSICKICPPFGGDKAKSEVELTWSKNKKNELQ